MRKDIRKGDKIRGAMNRGDLVCEIDVNEVAEDDVALSGCISACVSRLYTKGSCASLAEIIQETSVIAAYVEDCSAGEAAEPIFDRVHKTRHAVQNIGCKAR